MASPRNNCVAHVYRFASEYQKMMMSATGDRTKHSQLSCAAAATNAIDITTTKTVASVVDMRPLGISRDDVRGFAASNRASTRRLKPIAALRAVTMHTIIHSDVPPGDGMLPRRQQRAGQRERQREHRMAESHERQIGARDRSKHPHLFPVEIHAVLENFHVPLGIGGRREAVAAVQARARRA